MTQFFSYLQGRYRDADIGKGHVDMGGDSGINWQSMTDIYTLPCVKQPVGSCRIAQELSSVLCAKPARWDGDPGRGMCIHTADSLQYSRNEHNTVRWFYPSKKSDLHYFSDTAYCHLTQRKYDYQISGY